MARKTLTVDGTNLATFGVYISGQGTFSAPEKTVTFFSVPGRDGDVMGADSRLSNINVTYPCFIYSNLSQNMRDLRSFLLSRSGYVEISDTYHTDEYRLGAYLGPFEPEITQKNDAGSFDLTFICKPQRYLTSGKTAIDKTANFSITNPTHFNAKPIWRIYGTGYITVTSSGGVTTTVTISSSYLQSYIDIDSETMQAYDPTLVNAAGYVSITSSTSTLSADPPVLYPGSNSVALSGVTRVRVTPRWWEV